MRTQVQPLASLSGLGIWRCRELWCSLDLALLWLWLWRRPAAAVLIGPQAWEPPYAAGAALKSKKKGKKKRIMFWPHPCCICKILSTQGQCVYLSTPELNVAFFFISLTKTV